MMEVRPSDFPPGLIGCPCNVEGRWSDFTPDMVQMLKPPGTKFMMKPGLGVARPLNDIGLAFMAESNLQWLFLVNDDNFHPADTLIRLLHRMYPPEGRGTQLGSDIDVVSGLYLSKLQPFEPIAFYDIIEPTESNPGRWFKRFFLTDQRGLVEIVACGDGCLLVHREVMDTIGYPWWEYGSTVPGATDHDITFSLRVKEAGFRIWLDLDVQVDHMGAMAARPVFREGRWKVHLVQSEGRIIQMPAATEQEAFNRLIAAPTKS